MRILVRILQFIVWLIFATWLGRKLLGWMFGPAVRAAQEKPRSVANRDARPLFRDPVCGMHVSGEISLTLELDGQVHHFCSPACRERFRQIHARAASA